VNGEEIAAPGALPLGLVNGARYDIVTSQLAAGDRLTFVSDGVVEAQSRNGELLGFERTRAMSRQSAEAIANAAQEFGQMDDITVVTVEFKGVPRDGAAAAAAMETVRPATA
jgi:serine phosphatase RsbU (regulator of sigma subunit)